VSKSLGPDLRLAVVAGDATTIARVEGRQSLGAGWVSHILQEIVEILWSDPAVAKKLQLAAATYTTRRTALIDALKAHGIAAHGRSGLNVWIPVREEGSLISSLSAAGWAVRGGERYCLKSPPAIRVTIATLQPSEAIRLADDIARSVHPDQRTQVYSARMA
jgi:DNA-binding transcriptional MocR family regulator